MAWWDDTQDAVTGGGPGGAAAGAVAGGLLGGPFGAVAGGAWGAGGFQSPIPPGYHAAGYNPDPNAFVDPYHDANADKYTAGAAGAGSRDVGGQFRADQQGLIDMLQESANGGGPSRAQELLASGTEKNLASAASLAASGATAGNPALAQRSLAHTQAGIAQGVAGEAAALGAQEQLNARGQLGQALEGARGQDIQTQQLNDTLTQYYTSIGFANDQAQFAAAQALEALRVQEALGQQGINAGSAASDRSFWSNIVGAGLGAAGAAGGAFATSDERTKKNIVPGDMEVQQLLDALEAKGYDYRRAGVGMKPGRHVGVMAQDLEAAGPAGAGMVTTGPDGVKQIDGGQGFGAVLAADANLHKRVKALEAGSGAVRGAASPGLSYETLPPEALEPMQDGSDPARDTRHRREDSPGIRFMKWLGVEFGNEEHATSSGAGG